MNANKPPSAVRKSLGDFAPKLVDLTEDVLFGDVWERPELSKRDRSHSTSSSAAAAEFEGISEQGLEASRPYSRISSREQAAVAGGGQQARLEKLAPSTCLSAPTGFRGY